MMEMNNGNLRHKIASYEMEVNFKDSRNRAKVA
jgi:hypothetical protein